MDHLLLMTLITVEYGSPMMKLLARSGFECSTVTTLYPMTTSSVLPSGNSILCSTERLSEGATTLGPSDDAFRIVMVWEGDFRVAVGRKGCREDQGGGGKEVNRSYWLAM